MKLMSIVNVEAGDCLAKTILDDEGRILLKEGVLLTDFHLKRIRQIQIPSIYIEDKDSIIVSDKIINTESRRENIKAFFNNNNNNNNNEVSLKAKNINSSAKKFLNDTTLSRESIEETTTNIINEIKHIENVMSSLSAIKKIDYYTYQHSVNVAQFSIVLGVQLNLNQNELYTLCIGALLHDIGKVLVPEEIMQKTSTLENEEFEIIKEHTTKGYDYLKGCSDIPWAAKKIVLEHHERMDGRGYPNNIEGNAISKLSRIVAIADVYDALISDRPYRKAVCPNDAVEYILSNGDIQFDYEMVKAFSKAIVPYPTGTLVELSNGDIAVVTDVFHDFALRPKVRIIKRGISTTSLNVGESVSLMDHLDIVIEKIRHLA